MRVTGNKRDLFEKYLLNLKKKKSNFKEVIIPRKHSVELDTKNGPVAFLPLLVSRSRIS